MESVAGLAEDIKALEKSLYEKHCANARAEFQETVETADWDLAEARDKKRFRLKGEAQDKHPYHHGRGGDHPEDIPGYGGNHPGYEEACVPVG